MSNPDQAAAQASQATESFDTKVNSVVKQMTQDASGNWQMPEGEFDEAVRYAANAERRRRDTESALGKTKQQLKAESAARKELEKRVAAKVDIPADVQAELDELKHEDPEAWRVRMNKLEAEAQATLSTELSSVQTEASQQAELERRAEVLAIFRKEHPDVQLTDEVLDNEIPPRIQKKLANGQASFEEFLSEAYTYLKKGRAIYSPEVKDEPSLSKVGGSANPAAEAIAKDSQLSYKDEVY